MNAYVRKDVRRLAGENANLSELGKIERSAQKIFSALDSKKSFKDLPDIREDLKIMKNRLLEKSRDPRDKHFNDELANKIQRKLQKLAKNHKSKRKKLAKRQKLAKIHKWR
jgi:hypothetical protein